MDTIQKRARLVLMLLKTLEKELFITNKGKQAVIVSEASMVIELLMERVTELETDLRNVDSFED